ncbi:MAG: O-antigen ligase family protein [Pirellulaceae bacterium]|nr:O-antigen ligase family protein [Pirellulaceae bacterium]
MKKERSHSTSAVVANNQTSVLMLGVYFLTGMLLVLGQLLPSDASQIAQGEVLPQALLWLLVGALLATDYILTRYVSVQGRILATPGERKRFGENRWPSLLGIGLLVWVLIAICNVRGEGNFRFAVNAGWQWFAWSVALLVLARIMQNRQANRSLWWLMLALAWLVSVHGFFQVFVSLPADRERFRENPQAVLRQEAGIEAPPGSSTYLLFEQRLQDDSPTGPFALTNSLAGFLVPWIVILFARALKPEIWTRERVVIRFIGLIVALCLCICLLWTKSRTAWLALSISGLAFAITNPFFVRNAIRMLQGLWFGDDVDERFDDSARAESRIRNESPARALSRTLRVVVPSFLILVLLVVATIIVLSSWDPKLFTEASKSMAFRAEYWRTTMRLVSDHPWFGIGPGNFQAYYATYKPVLESETIADPHNFLLETLATAGWPSLVFLAGLILWLTKPFAMRMISGLAGEVTSIEDSSATNLVQATKGNVVSCTIFSGAISGLLATMLGNGALGPAPDYRPYLLAIPFVIVALVLDLISTMRSKSRTAQYKNLACGFGPALLGIGVHLLASGGWLTPGITNTIVILVAGLWIASRRDSHPADPSIDVVDKPDTRTRFQPWPAVFSFGVMCAAWFLVIAFYFTAWLPRQRSQEVQAVIAKQGGIDELQAIAMQRADPWNPVGNRWLTDVRMAQAERDLSTHRNSSSLSLDRYRESAQGYLASDRSNWETWAQLGHWELSLSPVRKDSLNRALDFYREASQRTPGDTGLLVQVALVAWLNEDLPLAKKFLEQAQAIDSNIAHADRKIDRAMLYCPPGVGPSSARVNPTLWLSARNSADLPQGWVRCEPLYHFLRSQISSLSTTKSLPGKKLLPPDSTLR